MFTSVNVLWLSLGERLTFNFVLKVLSRELCSGLLRLYTSPILLFLATSATSQYTVLLLY
jgi:hypothetical protein